MATELLNPLASTSVARLSQTLVAEYLIEPGTAIAYRVEVGQFIQIIDIAGSQCSDFLAFAADDYSEIVDSTVTRTVNGIATPQVGLHGKYLSPTMQPLVEVIQDTCGRHDSFLLACTARYYADAGYPGHPSCSENFNRVLAPFGISPRAGWPAINFFYNTQIDCHGAVLSDESLSRPGDYVLLQARNDLLCASSACPDDIDPANDWEPTPILIRIYDARESFPRFMGQRIAADMPLRLTADSAFTHCIRQLTDDLIEYNGFWVPNSFAHQGERPEYWALRTRAALMDLSSLRKFDVIGPDALALLNYAFSRNVELLSPGRSAYGCLLNPHGGIIDDGIVFCFGPTQYRYVGNCDTDGEWLQKLAVQHHWSVTIESVSDQVHNLALQGPQSRSVLQPLLTFPDNCPISDLSELGYFRFVSAEVDTIPVLLSRTGYTGELGYELFVHPQYGEHLWEVLIQAGQSERLVPLGMKALDRARIEAGLLASGKEFDDTISPYQAGIGWTVSTKKQLGIAKAALAAIALHPPLVAVGLTLDSDDIAAHGHPVYAHDERWRVGHITSATFSPILGRSIAMAQLKPEFAHPTTRVEVGLLDGIKRRVGATVGALAAYDPTKGRVRQ